VIRRLDVTIVVTVQCRRCSAVQSVPADTAVGGAVSCPNCGPLRLEEEPRRSRRAARWRLGRLIRATPTTAR
jgi:hypothetical protein